MRYLDQSLEPGLCFDDVLKCVVVVKGLRQRSSHCIVSVGMHCHQDCYKGFIERERERERERELSNPFSATTRL